MPYRALMRYYQSFPSAIPQIRAGCPRVTHPSATQSSLIFGRILRQKSFVRLAGVRHAASVHPEPGSNSHVKSFQDLAGLLFLSLLFECCSSELSSFRNLFRVALLFSCQGSTSRSGRERFISYHPFQGIASTFFIKNKRNFIIRKITRTSVRGKAQGSA